MSVAVLPDSGFFFVFFLFTDVKQKIYLVALKYSGFLNKVLMLLQKLERWLLSWHKPLILLRD